MLVSSLHSQIHITILVLYHAEHEQTPSATSSQTVEPSSHINSEKQYAHDGMDHGQRKHHNQISTDKQGCTDTDYEAGREGMHITNAASQYQLLLVAKLSIPKPEIHLVAITASKDRLVLLIDNKVNIWIGSDCMTFKRFAFRLPAPVCMINKSII